EEALDRGPAGGVRSLRAPRGVGAEGAGAAPLGAEVAGGRSVLGGGHRAVRLHAPGAGSRPRSEAISVGLCVAAARARPTRLVRHGVTRKNSAPSAPPRWK